ncbi:hypothetical protein A2U01_0108481, partial [Trifolium medium]|nr:hypothetical protein [Trifolium medium]
MGDKGVSLTTVLRTIEDLIVLWTKRLGEVGVEGGNLATLV